MPEGHTLHRLARLHRRRYAGRPVAVSSPQGRFAAGARVVDGRMLEHVEAHGKHLFHHFGPDRAVHVHLGLYGTVSDERLPVRPPRGLVRMRMVGQTHHADLRGPTTCELITDAEAAAVHARLGDDPLRRDADPDRVWTRISRSRAPLATLLMDQAVIAGVGNVYRAELLFRHGIDPLLPGQALARGRWDALWADLVELMTDGVRRGRIETLRPEHDPRRLADAVPLATTERMGAERMGAERMVYVYRRADQPCRACGTPIAHRTHLARNLFWCPTCQPARKSIGKPGPDQKSAPPKSPPPKSPPS